MKDKLLLVGVSSDTLCVLDYCKKIGVYTIVTDYIPVEKSRAKQLADEYWMIDVYDIDALEKECREAGVRGVYTGNNEYILDRTRELAKRLGLPYFASDAAWEVTRNKLAFREYCRSVGLDAPRLYFCQEGSFDQDVLRQIRYPVVVKPSDARASLGVTRCDTEKQLKCAYENAMKYSVGGRVMMEEYIEGTEIAADYFLMNGKAQLSLFNVILHGEHKNGNNMLVAVSPSRLQDEFIKQCQDKIQKLCERLGSRSGFFFVEAIYAGGKFYFIEMIHRIDGAGSWLAEQKILGINCVKRMVNYTLGYEDPAPELPEKDTNAGCIFFYWVKPGRIGRITGRDEIGKMRGVEMIMDRYQAGDIVQSTGSMYGMAFHIFVAGKDKEELVERLRRITSVLKIFDEEGREMTEPFIPGEAILNT